MGIPAEKLPLLFDNDEHFSTRGTNNEKGTGLGLILVKELLQKNGGDLKVESKVNLGTTFYVSLPAEIKKALPEKVVEPLPALV